MKSLIKLLTLIIVILTISNGVSAQEADSTKKEKKKELPREKMKVGISGLGGFSSASGGNLIPGTIKFRPAWGLGAHIYLPIGRRLYIHYMLGYAKRGFNFNFSEERSTLTHSRVFKTVGYVKLNYIDKNITVGYKFNERFSAFTGVNIGVKIKSKTHYDQTGIITEKSTGKTSNTTYSYSKSGGDTSQDVIDYSILIGVRARLHENLAISLRYLYDFYGFNLGADQTSTDGNFLGMSSYYSSGIFLTLEGHIFSFSKKRKKDK